jgi:aerobic carbon-monoxide dehydrogenase small subunit
MEVEPLVKTIELSVNGARRSVAVEPRELLVNVLRERLELTGAHIGCETTSCGACTVLIDGESVKSCTMLGLQAVGKEITTIEGLADGGELHPIQLAFHNEHALQCGYCTPGMVLAVVSLLRETPAPSEADIRRGLEGNLCRCTGYQNIVRAVQVASDGEPLEER